MVQDPCKFPECAKGWVQISIPVKIVMSCQSFPRIAYHSLNLMKPMSDVWKASLSEETGVIICASFLELPVDLGAVDAVEAQQNVRKLVPRHLQAVSLIAGSSGHSENQFLACLAMHVFDSEKFVPTQQCSLTATAQFAELKHWQIDVYRATN